jgi:hypothetical protein
VCDTGGGDTAAPLLAPGRPGVGVLGRCPMCGCGPGSFPDMGDRVVWGLCKDAGWGDIGSPGRGGDSAPHFQPALLGDVTRGSHPYPIHDSVGHQSLWLGWPPSSIVDPRVLVASLSVHHPGDRAERKEPRWRGGAWLGELGGHSHCDSQKPEACFPAL